MSDAQSHMEDAKCYLTAFQNSFLSFADFFFDGFVADYLMQSKVSEAKQQVADAIDRVEGLLAQLKNKEYV